ncbi:hypothetical protein HPB50_017728 [Hyalomma asiaticum]|uniref:Uncharacterized protein n=1 Tax=Hyalomma asiaticum TaxID=266040 RepID=A0ACB7SXD8_HYAAI|nr:hypothetical protein HPB50_017728 [Hyalomma asiaticum]
MLRSELYRQVRHLQDWLYHVCLKSEKPWAVSSRLQRLWCSTAALTEVYWNQLRANLPKKHRRCAAGTPVAYLDGASLPPNFDELLKMGPKFSLEPWAQKHELLATNHLRLLQADKEGAFVIMPSSAFDMKASEAIEKNFKVSMYKPRKAKAVALRLISELNPDVLEKGGLVPKDPFTVQSSSIIVENLSRGFPSANAAFSVDIEDMFYSIRQDELLEAVRELIESSGTVPFQNMCGIPLGSFLELLGVYLRCPKCSFTGCLIQARQHECMEKEHIVHGSPVSSAAFSVVSVDATKAKRNHLQQRASAKAKNATFSLRAISAAKQATREWNAWPEKRSAPLPQCVMFPIGLSEVGNQAWENLLLLKSTGSLAHWHVLNLKKPSSRAPESS